MIESELKFFFSVKFHLQQQQQDRLIDRLTDNQTRGHDAHLSQCVWSVSLSVF
jgi:hypothetical protein